MAQLPKGGLVGGHDKPIHGSCAIYFPGGINFTWSTFIPHGPCQARKEIEAQEAKEVTWFSSKLWEIPPVFFSKRLEKLY